MSLTHEFQELLAMARSGSLAFPHESRDKSLPLAPGNKSGRDKSPKGLGYQAHKPLMRRPNSDDAAVGIGVPPTGGPGAFDERLRDWEDIAKSYKEGASQ